MSISRSDIEKYIFTSLGHPVVSVELAPEQIGYAIDTALNEYLSVGAFEIDFQMLTLNNGTANEFDLPENVGTVKAVQYSIPFQTAAGSTEDIFSFAVYASPFGPNYTNFIHAAGNLGVFFEYLENRNRAIANEVTFEVINNKLYVWPFPKDTVQVLIKYSKNAFGLTDKDGSISLSNAWGTNWLRKMSLALCKGILGKIRGKYSSIAGGPGTEAQTLNSAELVAESKEEIAVLKEELLSHVSHVQFFIA